MTTTPQQPDPDSRETAWQEFRRERERSLAAPHGVLSQVALHWVDAGVGPQTFDEVPGRWQLEDGRLSVTWDDEELSLLAGEPDVELTGEHGEHRADVVSTGDVPLASFGDDVHIDVMRRGGRTGLRLLDPSAPRRTGFSGVPTYPYDPAFDVTGTWTAQPAEVTVGSVLPWLEHDLPSPGIATIELGGTQMELTLTGESAIMFTDETSGDTSAGWRVVTAELDGSGLRVAFNRAVNFPSAFSAWATCPHPPAGNHIPLPVRAGERAVEQTPR